MIISSVKCPWKDSEGKASITTQTKSIYEYLQATIDEKNAGGLIYDDADFVGAWDSFFDEKWTSNVFSCDLCLCTRKSG